MFRSRSFLLPLVALISVTLASDTSRAVAAVPTPSLKIELGAKPAWVAVDPSTNRAYVTNSTGGSVSVVDLTAGAVTKEIAVGPAPFVVAIDPVLGRGYVSDFNDGTVTVLDLTSERVIATLRVGGLGLAVDTTTHRVYAAGGRDIAVIDGATAQIIDVFAAPSGANLGGLAVEPGTGRVFATDLFNPRVLVLDGADGSVLGSVALSAPGRLAIAIDAAGARVHVATYVRDSAELVTFSARSLAVTGRLPVDDLPFALALDPARGSVYVGGHTSGNVSVASAARSAVTARLATGGTLLGAAVAGDRLLLVDQTDLVLGLRGRLLVIDLAGKVN